MKKMKRYATTLFIVMMTALSMSAWNSLPRPGSGSVGGNSLPAPGTGGFAGSSLPAPGSGGSYNPAPSGGSGWGSSWGPGFGSNSLINNPGWQNNGVENVMACGYDAQGIWRNLPLTVAYSYNGINYNVTVVNAWNPWTDMWNRNIGMPAYSTNYFVNGITYDYYAPLSTGTYYFNL